MIFHGFKIGSYQKYWIHLGKLFNLDTFIETGTAYCTTILEVAPHFKNAHTIELMDEHYNRALELTKGTNITPHQGSTDVKLREVLEKIPNTPTLFFLDAHFHDANGNLLNDPLPGEIAAIKDLRPDALIVIDDQTDDKLSNVIAAGVDISDYEIIYDNVRMVMMYKKGLPYYWDGNFRG